MNLSRILAELTTERRKLDAAIRALRALAGSSLPRAQHARRVFKKGKTLASARLSGITTVSGNLLMFPLRGRKRGRAGMDKGLSGGGRQA